MAKIDVWVRPLRSWMKLKIASVCLAGMAIAIPTVLHSADKAPDCSDDAMLVFDASESMAKMGFNDQSRARITGAREALHRILPQVTPFRRLGLIAYGPGREAYCSNPVLHLRPVENAAASILAAVDGLEPGGNTPLTQSVRMAAEVLNSRNNSGVIVLVTDGGETCGGEPCRLAQTFSREHEGLVVHVIGFQIRGVFFQSGSQNANEPGTGVTVGRCLADETGGKYVNTETAEDLVDALRHTLGCAVVGRKFRSSSFGRVG